MKQVAQAIWRELLPYAPVFTTSEVADVAGVSLPNASRDLGNLVEDGMVARVRRGLWAVPSHPDFSPYAVIPHLFGDQQEGYLSVLSALNLHGMIDQIPRVVQIVTTGQRSRLETPVGTFEFHQLHPALFGGFGPYRDMGNFDIATPEKALFDTLYLSARKGRRFSHLPEMEIPTGFSPALLEEWIAKVEYEPLRLAVYERWKRLDERAGLDLTR
ncbi:MAG: hypothetical protein WD766_02625 [Gemmatimonadota bacterium]